MISVSVLSNENVKKKTIIMFAILDYIFLLLFILCPNVEAQEGDSWDLPKNLKPVKYALTLITFLEKDNLNFSGDITIEVRNGCF